MKSEDANILEVFQINQLKYQNYHNLKLNRLNRFIISIKEEILLGM